MIPAVTLTCTDGQKILIAGAPFIAVPCEGGAQLLFEGKWSSKIGDAPMHRTQQVRETVDQIASMIDARVNG